MLWVWLCSITLFHCSVIMHSFQPKKFQILPHFTSYLGHIHFKALIGFALCVSRTKGHSFLKIWDISVGGACSQWKELALVMRKCLPFLIIDANSPIDSISIMVYACLSIVLLPTQIRGAKTFVFYLQVDFMMMPYTHSIIITAN